MALSNVCYRRRGWHPRGSEYDRFASSEWYGQRGEQSTADRPFTAPEGTNHHAVVIDAELARERGRQRFDDAAFSGNFYSPALQQQGLPAFCRGSVPLAIPPPATHHPVQVTFSCSSGAPTNHHQLQRFKKQQLIVQTAINSGMDILPMSISIPISGPPAACW